MQLPYKRREQILPSIAKNGTRSKMEQENKYLDKYGNVTFRQFFTQMFMSNKAISSKRVAGLIGWVICIFISLWCVFTGIEAPNIIDSLFWCTAGLLGLDSITGIWKKTPVEETKPVEEPKKQKNNG